MQVKNEKISGIMADDDKRDTNIDLLLNNLMVEIAKESEEDMRKQKNESTTHRLELTNNDHDIDKEITELETLIKRLQAEIVEMSETATKPLPSHCPGFSAIEENRASDNGACYASPEKSNEEEPESDIGSPIISKDDGVLEQQVKMFAENISNIIKASNNTNSQKDDVYDVRQNFNVLWDDPTNSNLDLTEKPTETIISKLPTAFNFGTLPSSLQTNKPMLINNISIESIQPLGDKAQIELCENASELCDGTSLNDDDTLNDTHDDDSKISADNKLLGDSIYNYVISGSDNEVVADDIITNVPITLTVETPYNFPGNIESHLSSIVNTTVPKDTIISLPKPETVEAAKTTIIKTLENEISSDNTCTPEPSQVIPLATPTDTPEMMKQTQIVTRESSIPMPDSILKNVNRKICKIVGRASEKSISKEKHKSEDLLDKDISKEFRKAFPRSRSEPSKNFCISNDDNSIINLKNITALTQDSPKNVIKAVSDTINTKNSKTSNFETSNIKAVENSNEYINIVNKIIPTVLCNDLIIDKSKSITENPSDTTSTTATLSTESDSPSKSFYKEMPINTPNGPQTIYNENINYNISTTDLSRKNSGEDLDNSASVTSSISSALPKFNGSNIQNDGQQENVMKTDVTTLQARDGVEDVQGNKLEEDVEAEEDEEDDDDGDDDGEKEDDVDNDDNTYDVD